MTSKPDAAVIGAGHNGLVAANVLADAGWSVTVLEAEQEPGGALRSGEPVERGFVHDHCASFFPLGAASPVFRALGLEVPWRHGPLVLAHPARDGSCAVLERDGGVEEWRRIEPAVLRGLVTPFPQVRAAAAVALEPGAARLLRLPRDELERRIVVGNALHTDLPPTSLPGRAFGVALTMLGRRYGFPCVAGGASTLTRLLVEGALARGVELRCGVRVERLPRARRAVVVAVDAWELGRLLGRPSALPPDPAVLKVDWALEGPAPWRADAARRSPVVHLGGPGRFAIFGQYALADPSRAPAGKEAAWAYTRDLPSADALEAEVEALAPGFRASIRGRNVERLPPGRVSLGTMRRLLVLRGRLGRPETGVPGVFLASASAHPGGGVHGAPGWIAAHAALRSARGRR
ncbi:MAG TPA: NAD(P)/FAD-dependent oxidoreductase [Gaiellaceae bacterium]|nr:NAD(P)/FAD-dependent oxidoreductase [Gaiellaceae bacterium]